MKKFLTLFLVISLLCSQIVIVRADARNPYDGFKLLEFDSSSNTSASTSAGYLGNTGTNKTYTYNDVDFGETAPNAIVVETGSPEGYAGGTVYVYIDSATSDPIAQFVVQPSNWSEPLAHTCKISTSITGVHTVILKTPSKGAVNFFKMKFRKPASAEDSYEEYKEVSSPFVDIAKSVYRKDINLLWELGLLNSEEGQDMYYPELLVTRGRFIKVLVNCLTDINEGSGKQIFTDILPGSEFFDVVSYAKEAGLIGGFGDGSFRPDEFIMTKDAVSVVCRMLGYDFYAQGRGGYSNGYMSVAREYDILDGLETGEYLSNGAMARLIKNAIYAPFLDISAIQGDDAVYTLNKNGILSGYHNIYFGEGLVEANDVSGVSIPNSQIDGNRVSINGEKFKAGTTSARSLLGYECEFFYCDDNDEKTIVSIQPLDNVETTSIASYTHDIESISAEQVVYYDENGKRRKIEIGDDCYILYNGVAVDNSLSNLISTDPFRGRLRFIKNTNYKNTLMIDEYVNIVIGVSDKSKSLVYDELKKKKYAFDDDDLVYIKKDGMVAQYDELQAGDVAMVYESKNRSGKKLVQIMGFSETVTGTITEICDNNVTIDEKVYRKAIECTDELIVGETVKVSINGAEEIVTAQKASSPEEKIAWMLDCGTNNTNSLSPVSRIRVLDTDNVIREYTLASSGYVDGVSYKNNTIVLSDAMVDKIVDTPVRYRVNKDGLITEIDSILSGAGGEKDKLSEHSLQGNGIMGVTDSLNYAGNRILSSLSTGRAVAIFRQGAKILQKNIPASGALPYNPDNNIWVTSFSNEKLSGQAYSFDPTGVYVDIFVRVDTTEKAGLTTTSAFVFDGIITMLDSEGEVCEAVVGYLGSEKLTYPIRTDVPSHVAQVKALSKGDWIYGMVDSKGNLASLKILYLYGGAEKLEYKLGMDTKTVNASLHEDNGIAKGIRSGYQYEKYAYGTVEDRDGKFIKVKLKGSDTMDYLHLGSDEAICYIPSQNPNIENKVSVDNVMIGDTVLVEIVSNVTRSVYIVGQ